jgi:AraC family transcriptional regulator
MIAEPAIFKIVEFPKRRFAYIGHVGPYKGNSKLFEELFNKVQKWAKPQGFMNIPDMEAITIYHDHPDLVPEEKQRISVGFTVPLSVKHAEGEVEVRKIKAGKYALGHFEILPEDYGEAWEEMMGFISDEKLVMSDTPIMYESYKNDPQTHPEGKHRVDICISLMKN